MLRSSTLFLTLPNRITSEIPFSLADRTARTQSHLIETFLGILNLADSRLGASRVLALLESAPVRKSLGLLKQTSNSCATGWRKCESAGATL